MVFLKGFLNIIIINKNKVKKTNELRKERKHKGAVVFDSLQYNTVVRGSKQVIQK